MIIDGKAIAREILDELKKGPRPEKFLAGILVGNDSASESFQKLKQRTAESLGWDYRIYRLSTGLGQDGLRQEVGRIADQKSCGGVIVQLPLPEGMNQYYVLNAIPPEKDPDVLSARSLGGFYVGRSRVLQPAAATVEEILRRQKFGLSGKKVAVVGPGFLVGRPIAAWLTGKAAEVIAIGRSSDYSDLAVADLVVLGVGKAGLVKPSQLKAGAAVIDFGYSEDKATGAKLAGDLDLSEDAGHLDFYTPTPGGTGPILVAKLFQNFSTLQGLGKSRQSDTIDP